MDLSILYISHQGNHTRCDLSFSMFSGFIHVVCIRSPFLFLLNKRIIFHCIDMPYFFIHRLNCFCFGAIINMPLMKIYAQVFMHTYIFDSLGYTPYVWNCWVICSSVFNILMTCQLFSKVTESFCNPTSHV